MIPSDSYVMVGRALHEQAMVIVDEASKSYNNCSQSESKVNSLVALEPDNTSVQSELFTTENLEETWFFQYLLNVDFFSII